MNRRVLAAAVLGAATWLAVAPETGWAFGRRTSGDCGGCSSPCAYSAPVAYAPSHGGCCGPVAAPVYGGGGCCGSVAGAGAYAPGVGVYGAGSVAPAVASAPTATAAAAPCFTTQTVTRYRAETRTRQVPVTVMKPVTKKEQYTYTEMVPETVNQTQTVTEMQQVQKQVPVNYTEYVTEVVNQPRQVTEMRQVTRQVPYTYTVMQAVTVNEQRQVTEMRQVVRQVPYTYTVMQPVTTNQQRQVTEYQQVTKQVPYTYTVMQPVTTNQQRQVTEYQQVVENVPYTYTESVPVTTMQAQTRQVCVTVPQTVTRQVPVTRQVAVAAPAYANPYGGGIGGGYGSPCGSPCGNPCDSPCGNPCGSPCGGGSGIVQAGFAGGAVSSANPCVSYQTVTEMQTVQQTVMTQQMQSQTVNVPVTTYQAVQRTGTRQVCRNVPVTRTVTVPVTTYQPVQQTATRQVVENVPVTRTVTVPVTTYQPVQQTATRQVCEYVPETKTVTVPVVKHQPVQQTATRTVCEYVPETKTVNVAVQQVKAVQKQTTQTVVECVPVQKQVTVPVTTMKAVQKTGTRDVTEYVASTENRTETYTEMVPYTETIQVPVAAPAVYNPCDYGYGAGYGAPSHGGYGYGAGYGGGCGGCGDAPSAAPCDNGGGRRRGLLSRLCGGCSLPPGRCYGYGGSLHEHPGDVMTACRRFALATILLSTLGSGISTAGEAVEIETRTRRETAGGGEEAVSVRRTFEPAKSAVIICDMWDDHWCRSAATRCDALARTAGPLVEQLRKSGVTIIHCPSDCMAYYKDHPARKRTRALMPSAPPKSKDLPDPPLPIDDSDGGCDDGPTPFRKAWTKQHDAIRVDAEKDFVTDSGKEVYNILADRGIKTVFVMGVHTNMCVLHRSFAIKQLRRWGVDCLLVRDITDAMYNPKMKPFVSHDEGTQLVIRYIERHWCPTVASKGLVKK